MKKMAMVMMGIMMIVAMWAGQGWAGVDDTLLGNNAGHSLTTGNYYNTFIGSSAGYSNNSGNYNTYIGSGAGSSSSGSRNVFLGYYAGHNADVSNRLYIDNCYAEDPQGYCAPLIYGEFDNRIVQVNGTLIMTAVFSPSDERQKKNIVPLKASLDKVMHLQGVSYEWRTEEYSGRGFGKGKEIGLIAQNVEAVIPELVISDSKGYKALAYDKLIPVLVEAIKEQEAVIREQEKQNIQKEARIMKLEKTLELMGKRIASIENPAKTIALE